jgi:tripartite-type tricarboxylate transporter receptor subunit TctC
LATPGNGTPSHLISELFQKTADIQLTHVPYKGATGALTDLIGGRVSLMMSSVPTALGQIKNGKIRAIAVSASKRIHVLPDVPTIGESGYSGFQIGTWYGLFVPKNTPSSIVLEINSAANESLKTAVLNEKILAEGGVVLGGDSQSFANLVKADFALWGKIVKESGAVID